MKESDPEDSEWKNSGDMIDEDELWYSWGNDNDKVIW